MATSGAIALELTIPGDARLVETVRALAVQVLAHVWYSDAESRAMGGALASAVAALVDPALGRDPSQSVAVSFKTDRDELEIVVRYAAEDGLPVHELRRVMSRVDVVRESGTSVCRLRRPLP